MKFDVASFLSGISGVLLAAGIVALWLRHLLSRLKDLQAEVDELKATRIAKLEAAIAAMQEGCVGKVVKESLRNLEGWMNKIDLRLAQISDETASQKTAIQHDHQFISEVSKEFRSHANDRSLHSG